MSILVSVEGGDYTGKSSFIVPFIEKILKCMNYTVITSREPGGSKKAEKIRKQIFDLHKKKADASTLAILFNKARKIHIEDIIIPAMGISRQKNTIMILDRYLDSTRVYQGLQGGVNLEILKDLENKYVGSWYPDLTIILYINPVKFKKIMKHRIKLNSHNLPINRDITGWDLQDLSLHFARQNNYLSIPKIAADFSEKRKFIFVDITENPKKIMEQCVDKILNMTAKKITLIKKTEKSKDSTACINKIFNTSAGKKILNLHLAEKNI